MTKMPRGSGLAMRAMGTLVGALLLSGCGRPVTAAELDAYEARAYPGHPKGEVFKAATLALRSQGYEVIASDAASGRIKTAPKVVVVHAARTSSSTAVAASQSVAWNLDIRSDGSGAFMHAEPRLYSAGQSIEATRLNQDYAERLFSGLYREIDDNLGGAATTTAGNARR